MSYNVHHCADADERPRLREIAQLIKESRPLVVSLQEIDQGTRRSKGVMQLDELEKQTGLNGHFQKSINYSGGEYGLGFLFAPEFEVESFEKMDLAYPKGKEARTALIVKAQLDGKALLVINSHFSLNAASQEASMKLLMRCVDDHPDRAAILMGDFNFDRSSPLFEEYFLQGGFETGPNLLTFTSSNPTRQIDFIAISPSSGITAKEYNKPTVYHSDHFPIRATLAFQ